MTDALGPNTRGVLHLISHLDKLDADQIDTVVAEWRRQPARARAEAWATIRQSSTPDEAQAILTAAALGRREAMAVAARAGRHDWEFWAAVRDAVVAVDSCDRIDEQQYHVLVDPLAVIFPWLSACLPDRVDATGLQAMIVRIGASNGRA
jgi:hypothetical protein